MLTLSSVMQSDMRATDKMRLVRLLADAQDADALAFMRAQRIKSQRTALMQRLDDMREVQTVNTASVRSHARNDLTVADKKRFSEQQLAAYEDAHYDELHSHNSLLAQRQRASHATQNTVFRSAHKRALS